MTLDLAEHWIAVACAILSASCCAWSLGRRSGERSGAAKVYAAAHDLFRAAARNNHLGCR